MSAATKGTAYTADHANCRQRQNPITLRIEREMATFWECCDQRTCWDLVDDNFFANMEDGLRVTMERLEKKENNPELGHFSLNGQDFQLTPRHKQALEKMPLSQIETITVDSNGMVSLIKAKKGERLSP